MPSQRPAVTRSDANKMWGGRFAMSPAELMVEINASIGFDKAMAPQDIAGSKAHAEMLARQGIISKADAREILKGLEQVRDEKATWAPVNEKPQPGDMVNVQIATSAGTAYSDTGLSAGVSYGYRVRASDTAACAP